MVWDEWRYKTFMVNRRKEESTLDDKPDEPLPDPQSDVRREESEQWYVLYCFWIIFVLCRYLTAEFIVYFRFWITNMLFTLKKQRCRARTTEIEQRVITLREIERRWRLNSIWKADEGKPPPTSFVRKDEVQRKEGDEEKSTEIEWFTQSQVKVTKEVEEGIMVPGIIGGVKKILIELDSGSRVNLISSTLCCQLEKGGYALGSRKSPFKLLDVQGNQISQVKEPRIFNIAIGKKTREILLHVVELSGEVLLGRETLIDFGFILDFSGGQARVLLWDDTSPRLLEPLAGPEEVGQTDCSVGTSETRKARGVRQSLFPSNELNPSGLLDVSRLDETVRNTAIGSVGATNAQHETIVCRQGGYEIGGCDVGEESKSHGLMPQTKQPESLRGPLSAPMGSVRDERKLVSENSESVALPPQVNSAGFIASAFWSRKLNMSQDDLGEWEEMRDGLPERGGEAHEFRIEPSYDGDYWAILAVPLADRTAEVTEPNSYVVQQVRVRSGVFQGLITEATYNFVKQNPLECSHWLYSLQTEEKTRRQDSVTKESGESVSKKILGNEKANQNDPEEEQVEVEPVGLINEPEGDQDDELDWDAAPCTTQLPYLCPVITDWAQQMREADVAPPEHVESVIRVLARFPTLISSGDLDIGTLDESFKYKHSIKLNTDRPVFQKPFKLSPIRSAQMAAALEKLCEAGILENAESPNGMRCFFVPKRSGELRLVYDGRFPSPIEAGPRGVCNRG